MTYNWKGQGYESLEAFRSHLIYFEWPLVEEYLKDASSVPAPVKEALSLREIPGTKPSGKQSSKKTV